MPLAAGVPAGNREISGGILRSAACFFGPDCAILYGRLKGEGKAMAKERNNWMKAASIVLMTAGFILLGVHIFAVKQSAAAIMIPMGAAVALDAVRRWLNKKKEDSTDEK